MVRASNKDIATRRARSDTSFNRFMETFMKSLATKLLAIAAFAAFTTSLMAPVQAFASGGSLGHGVKCWWVLVSYDAATGTSTYTQVCAKLA
jgi:hypothetical protein